KMKKMYKMMLVLLILGILVTGCSSGNGSKSASSENYELTDVSFPLQEKVTLKIMTSSSPLAPSDPNEKLIFQRIEEQTGVNVEWKNYTSDSFAEKRNLAMASGELPDA